MRYAIPIVTLAALCAACGSGTDCSPVAKLVFYESAHKSQVKVLRPSRDAKLSEQRTDRLCAGDRVQVAGGVEVAVKYLELGETELKLRGPGEFPVLSDVRAGTPLGNLVKKADVFHWFTHASDERSVAGAISRSAGMTTPLDAGNPGQVPMFVRTDLQRIAFFWQGGQAPWRVELLDAAGAVVASTSVQEPQAEIASPATAAGREYRIVVRSSDGRTLRRKIELAGDAAKAGSGDVGEPDWGAVVSMLSDPQRNWRLQVWSELARAPESSMKSAVTNRLRRGP